MVTGKSHATSDDDGNEAEAGISAKIIGRYTLHSRIAAGGMASVYLGSLTGAADFSRMVAIKRMHPQFAADSEFIQRFRSEAWLNSRLVHPNIVQTLDVVEWGDELLLVMEYIHGVTLGALCGDARAAGRRLPCGIATGILVQVLHGLHAAHIATDDDGRTLGIVHRDFTPQNIIVSRDGQAKVLDFGIARARAHVPITAVGQVAGKYGYLAPEQIVAKDVDQRTDIFAAGIVLWEALTGERLFREPNLSEPSVISLVLTKAVPPPSQVNSIVPPALDEIVLRALIRDPEQRFATAREMALALESVFPVSSPSSISAYVTDLAAKRFARLARMLARTRRSASLVAHALAAETAVAPGAADNQKTVVSSPFHDSPVPPRLHKSFFWRLLIPSFFVLVIVGWLIVRTRNGGDNRAPLWVPLICARPLSGGTESLSPRDTPPGASNEAEVSVAPSTPGSAMVVREPRAQTKSPGGPTRSRSRSAAPQASAAVRSRPVQSGAKKTNCDPPTYTDSQGIRHFKDGCL
jgi:serine/threonine-protein kinase